jgi:uncharacterized membrane protein
VRNARLFLAVRAVGVFLVVAPFVPPLFALVGWDAAATLTDAPWALFCHRLPDRVLSLFGEPMPICSRCLGIFAGLGAGLGIAWPELPARRLLFVAAIAALAMLVEVATQEAGLHRVFHPTRLLSGLLLAYPIGATAAALVRRTFFQPKCRAIATDRENRTH